MGNHPPPQPPRAPREVIRRDVGSWISGPSRPLCARCGDPKPDDGNLMHSECEEAETAEALAALRGTEPVRAEHVMAGDTVLIDGTEAEITDVRHGDYWLTTGQHGPGVALGWRCGSSSGIMFRRADDTLDRIS